MYKDSQYGNAKVKLLNAINKLTKLFNNYLIENWFEDFTYYNTLSVYFDWDSYSFKGGITTDYLTDGNWNWDRIEFTPDTMEDDRVEDIMAHMRRGAEIIPCALNTNTTSSYITAGSTYDDLYVNTSIQNSFNIDNYSTYEDSTLATNTGVITVSGTPTEDLIQTIYIPRETLYADTDGIQYRYPMLRFSLDFITEDIGPGPTSKAQYGFIFRLFRLLGSDYTTEVTDDLVIDSTITDFADGAYSFKTLEISYPVAIATGDPVGLHSIIGEFDLTTTYTTLFGASENNQTLYNERDNNETSILYSGLSAYPTFVNGTISGGTFPETFSEASDYHYSTFRGMGLNIYVVGIDLSAGAYYNITIQNLNIELSSKPSSRMYSYSDGWVDMYINKGV